MLPVAAVTCGLPVLNTIMYKKKPIPPAKQKTTNVAQARRPDLCNQYEGKRA
jgi:hypothetical protein